MTALNKSKKSILVIAPHADDEVLGCGGTIARHAALGNQVNVLVATRGIAELFPPEYMYQIHQEMQNAHKLLGVHKTYVLDFPAPKLDVIPGHELADAIKHIIEETQPETVYVPHRGDLHTDHQKIYTASLVATRPVNACTVRTLLSYETLSETDWASPSPDGTFVPTLFVDISKYLELKLSAMRCYTSQLKLFPQTRSIESLQALARVRGGTVSVDAAEAFMLIRHIEL